MTHFLQKSFIFFFLFITVLLSAQNSENDQPKDLNTKFIFGAGSYILNGDEDTDMNLLNGNLGYHTGVQFDITEKMDVSLLFAKTSFSTNLFRSEGDFIGVNLGYQMSNLFGQSLLSPKFLIGLQSLSFKTEEYDRESTFVIPLGLGVSLNLNKRMDFSVGLNYGLCMGDIDKLDIQNPQSDNFSVLNFSLTYDLFSKSEKVVTDLDKYFDSVDYIALDKEDEDGDLVLDINDYCPKTPIGVKVDKTGCPLDSDNDGIADYLDKQKNTPNGVIVDAQGVELKEEMNKSTYSEDGVASRKYANFYNEQEIKRENYKTIDEYLIAKANAFNKMYNQNQEYDQEIYPLRYKVLIGSYTDGVSPRIQNKLLSIDDLQSSVDNSGLVMYLAGNYETVDEAINREYELESRGFDETSIVVDNNGIIQQYVAQELEQENTELEEELKSSENSAEEVSVPDTMLELNTDKENNIDQKVNSTIYRIQIGAFKVELSEEIFKGIDNVMSFNGKDGYIRYMAGAFSNYQNAIDYMNEMRARGFEDAFIVTYKNGERVGLEIALRNSKKDVKQKEEENIVNINELDLMFVVQILVDKEFLDAEGLERLSKIGDIEKQPEGSEIYRYFAGKYPTIEEAKNRLQEVQVLGYQNAFILAIYNGQRISIEEAKRILND